MVDSSNTQKKKGLMAEWRYQICRYAAPQKTMTFVEIAEN